MFLIIEMRQHFPFIANVVGCLVTNGEFDFLANDELDFWGSALGTTFQKAFFDCHIGETFAEMSRHLEMYFTKHDPMNLEVLPTLKFLKSLTR